LCFLLLLCIIDAQSLWREPALAFGFTPRHFAYHHNAPFSSSIAHGRGQTCTRPRAFSPGHPAPMVGSFRCWAAPFFSHFGPRPLWHSAYPRAQRPHDPSWRLAAGVQPTALGAFWRSVQVHSFSVQVSSSALPRDHAQWRSAAPGSRRSAQPFWHSAAPSPALDHSGAAPSIFVVASIFHPCMH